MSWKLLESCSPVRLNKIAPMLLTTAYATNASIALLSADRIKSGIFRTGRAIGTSSLPPKNAAAYAATSAASRINWRSNPKRQPRTTSNKINTTAKERKTACQTSEPAIGCGSGVTAIDHRWLAAAVRDRKAPARPSLPQLALLEEERTDHGVRAPRARFVALNW